MLKRMASGAEPAIWSPGPAGGVVWNTAWGGVFPMETGTRGRGLTLTVVEQRALWRAVLTVNTTA